MGRQHEHVNYDTHHTRAADTTTGSGAAAGLSLAASCWLPTTVSIADNQGFDVSNNHCFAQASRA
jgi:hypothetical protein